MHAIKPSPQLQKLIDAGSVSDIPDIIINLLKPTAPTPTAKPKAEPQPKQAASPVETMIKAAAARKKGRKSKAEHEAIAAAQALAAATPTPPPKPTNLPPGDDAPLPDSTPAKLDGGGAPND